MAKRVPKGFRVCGWIGYLGEANYPDAACCGGEIGDADHCLPGGKIGLVDETCPNCHGKGIVPDDHLDVGGMALLRQRAQTELCSNIEEFVRIESADERKEWATEVCKTVKMMFGLIRKLEGGSNEVPQEAR